MSKEVKDFRCPVCDTVGKWTNVDEYRIKKEEMHSCDSCGFVTYPTKYQTEAEIKEYYKNNYRAAPQVGNLFTGERKLQYHAFFLQDVFAKWKKDNVEAPVIGEIGSAQGMFLNWLCSHFPKADVHGTELTETYKRVAFHEYGLKLEDDFNTKKKYDLIVSYHVLEHQTDPDHKLKEYADCLKDDGLFYLSCPIWFREASNGAMGGFDLEYHYHPDHINSWGEEHLEHIIDRCNLEIVMKNDNIYGNTYLLKKKSADAPINMKVWDVAGYRDKMKRIKECWIAINENRQADAIKAWPNSPAAWINFYEYNKKTLHESGDIDKFITDSIAACPNSAEMPAFAADIRTRYEQYDKALELFELALSRKPNNPSFVMGMANCFHMKAKKAEDAKEQAELVKRAMNFRRFVQATSTEMMPQATSWLYQDQAMLPVEH